MTVTAKGMFRIQRYGVIACMSTITQDLAHCRKLASAKV